MARSSEEVFNGKRDLTLAVEDYVLYVVRNLTWDVKSTRFTSKVPSRLSKPRLLNVLDHWLTMNLHF